MIVRLGYLVIFLQFECPAFATVVRMCLIFFQMFFPNLLGNNAEKPASSPQRHNTQYYFIKQVK